ncbi:MAG: DUF3575 domain-containing protein [Alistipes sp.]|nr:DUF3575 domain-containing protein [Rikenellaceae bacterium]MBQ7310785.1 DUF3575 domain-containing protein [Alistipes sp.]
MKLKFYIPLILGLLTSYSVSAQNDVAIKTNVLYDLTATINAGVEIGLAPRWTLDISGNFNAWDMKEDKKWKHYLVQPEARYWFCDRFMGHFLGIHAHGGQVNFGGIKNGIDFLGSNFSNLSDRRYQGWFAGAGVAYGYAFVLGRHWNLELELGVGYAYTKYDVFECSGCGRKVESGLSHHYVGPTKLALNLVYLF